MSTSLSSVSAGTTGSILRAAEQNVGVAAKLLKKATDADKDLVNTLLPTTGLTTGRLDTRA